MMRVLAATVAGVLLAGCGSAGPSASSDSSPTKSPAKVGSCEVGDPGVLGARTVARVDLDGDGQQDAVKLTAASGACPDLLFAKRGPGYVTAQLPTSEPSVSAVFGVDLAGVNGSLLVTRQDHPRGGFQLRVYMTSGAQLTELTVGRRSLLPFVALDVEEHPWSIDCGDGGLVFTEAVAHQPHGVVATWDIRRTTYTVSGGQITPGPTSEIADNVLPGQLAAKHPALAEHTAFASCRAA